MSTRSNITCADEGSVHDGHGPSTPPHRTDDSVRYPVVHRPIVEFNFERVDRHKMFR
jgi:hypothetical protein